MQRRLTLLTALLLAPPAALLATAAPPAPAKPNVIYIMSDELGYLPYTPPHGMNNTSISIGKSATRPPSAKATGPTAASTVIRQLRDNVTEPQVRSFYRVLPGGMREGVQAFSRPRPQWHAADPPTLPSWLEGAQ